MNSWINKIAGRMNAAQFAVFGFAAIIFIGALLLMLPISTKGESLGFVDAIFTATSATCVTGLTVADTGGKFTGFGQAVILTMIQIGGFGIMMLSTFILVILGRRTSFTLRDSVSGQFLEFRSFSLAKLLGMAVGVTFAFETAGAVILFTQWIGEYSFGRALWLSVFHSVSAFCNAGFSLFPDSLVRYAGSPVINFALIMLIVFGGIGFFLMADVWYGLIARKSHYGNRISFHARIVLMMTVILIVGGTMVFYGIERNHNLAGLSFGQALMRSLFQSVTTRTAGFNTLDVQHLANSSLFLIIVLMYIGGAPGSMAGGVKVTTVGVILVVIISRLRGMKAPGLFGRSITRANLEQALSLLIISGTIIGFMTMVLLMTELGGASHVDSRGMFIELLFEAVSAFGTVGLSTGVTPQLSVAGKVLITIMMFTGRLGPITLIFAMERRLERAAYRYPEEEILIG